ncbi:MAG: DUF3445 domain-containing protein [Leptolyngbyaceae cyanobacterium bins.349]|nr:DUF3445 domain-containing protein [Leptolyngbyaceae cyanobacterium bins.349]
MKHLEEQWLAEICPVEALDWAATYFPLASGRYEVKPGLHRFGTDFGNGEADQQVFQLDENFAYYHDLKQLARQEQLSKYLQTCEYADSVATAIAQFIIHRLLQEHPQYFELAMQANGMVSLFNHLTQEKLVFNSAYQLQSVHAPMHTPAPPYRCSLDALANQIQEDVTVVRRQGDRHWMSAIHLCFPNHWAAEAKIGQPFATVHQPVAGMESMNRRGDAIVHTMITHKPAVRFAWGLSTDTRLNHHPHPPIGIDPARWHGRKFDLTAPRLYLRVERQVVWGFPGVDAALFTIRTSFRDCRSLKQDEGLRSNLCAALRSMSAAALAYKGLTHSQPEILKWLEEP